MAATQKKKMQFQGALGFPLPLPGGVLRFDPQRLPAYLENNERGAGGWYPLGANQTWHNGIHLHGAGGAPAIHAVADGTIVAARLTQDWDKELHPFGSNCFVLLRHDVTLIDDPAQRRSWDTDTWSSTRDVTFYSLYMHLDPRIDRLEEVPWLASYRPFLRDGLRYEGQVWRVKKRDGAAASAFNLYAEPRPVDGQLTKVPALTGSATVGSLVELLGAPIEAQIGPNHHVYQRVKVIDAAKQRDAWKDGWIRRDGERIEQTDAQRIIRDLQNGGVVHVGCTVSAGDCIGHAGPFAAEGAAGDPEGGRGVHLEIFSAENLVANAAASGWTVCEDTSPDDVICEDRTLLGQLEKADPSLFAKLKAIWSRVFGDTVAVARRQYEEHLTAEDKAKLRRIITRNTTFWAIDWKAMAGRSENRAWRASYALPDAVLDAATRYSWWRELPPKAKSALPDKSLLFHYHPLEFLRYLHDRVPRAPVFFLERSEGGKTVRYVVSKVEHLDPNIPDKVSVYEPSFPDEHPPQPDTWILEKRKNYAFAAGDRQVPVGGGETKPGWAGLGYGGDPDLFLYRALIAKPHAGLANAVADCASATGISRRDLTNVWAAIWHSEGGLNAFNSYDNGHLSVGALQQIAGPVYGSGAFEAQGELGAAMHAVKTAGADGARLYERYFGRYGFDVGPTHTDTVGYAANRTLALDTAPPSPGGPVEVKTKADLAKARWFIWSWCVVRALRDPEFIRIFYGYGFKRLKIVRDLTHKFGSELHVPLGRLLETQLSQALVLDWHINSPGNAIPGWARAALGVAAPDFNYNVDWGTFDAAREYGIIAKIVVARRTKWVAVSGSPTPVLARTMTDGPRRSAFVVLCARGLSYPGKNQAYSQATWDAWANTHHAFLTSIGYPYGAKQLLWEANHDDTAVYPSPAPEFTVDQMKSWIRVLDYTFDFLEHERSSPAG